MPDPCIESSESVALTMDGVNLRADLLISTQPDQAIEVLEDGAYSRGWGSGAALPPSGSEVHGQQFFLMPQDGVLWPIRYNAGSAQARKWEAFGAAPIFSSVEGTINFVTDASPAGNWGDGGGGTPGPDIVIPYDGFYRVVAEATVDNSAISGSSGSTQFGVSIGTAADPGSGMRAPQNSIRPIHVMFSQELSLTAGRIIRMRYFNSWPSNTAAYSDRRVSLFPIRF